MNIVLHLEQLLINLADGLVVPAAFFFCLLIRFLEFFDFLLQPRTPLFEALYRHVRIDTDFLIELPDDGTPAVPCPEMADGIVDGLHAHEAMNGILECLAVSLLRQFLAHAVNPFAVKKEEARKLLWQDGFHRRKTCRIIERPLPFSVLIPLADKEILADTSVLIVELLPAELIHLSFLLDLHLDADRTSLPPQVEIADFAIDELRVGKSQARISIQAPEKRLLECRLARAILAHDDRDILLRIR